MTINNSMERYEDSVVKSVVMYISVSSAVS